MIFDGSSFLFAQFAVVGPVAPNRAHVFQVRDKGEQSLFDLFGELVDLFFNRPLVSNLKVHDIMFSILGNIVKVKYISILCQERPYFWNWSGTFT